MPSLDHDGPLQTDNTFVYYYLLLLYFTGIVNLALHLLDVTSFLFELSWYYFQTVVWTFGGCHTVHIKLQYDGCFYNAFIYY